MELGGCNDCGGSYPWLVDCDCSYYYLYKINISETIWAVMKIVQVVLSLIITVVISIRLFRPKKQSSI